jgi:hypothetical protein
MTDKKAQGHRHPRGRRVAHEDVPHECPGEKGVDVNLAHHDHCQQHGRGSPGADSDEAGGPQLCTSSAGSWHGTQVGPPGPGVYIATLLAIVLLEDGGANRTSLQEQIDAWKEVEQEEIIEEAPIIKTMKCYSDEDAKVVISIRDRSFAKVVNVSFKQLEGKVCTGKAPAGYLERELGEWIEALNAS